MDIDTCLIHFEMLLLLLLLNGEVPIVTWCSHDSNLDTT